MAAAAAVTGTTVLDQRVNRRIGIVSATCIARSETLSGKRERHSLGMITRRMRGETRDEGAIIVKKTMLSSSSFMLAPSDTHTHTC